MLLIENLSKRFTGSDVRAPALDDISFTINSGEFFTLLGPSGCGKTTALRSIAGLERPEAGQISINGKTVFDARHGIFTPANRRRIGMVFQSYAIWPHMDVFENIAFPLRVSPTKYSESTIRSKVHRALEIVEMLSYEKRPASRLSGGQQQRVAIARALVMEPEVLLLDEPLSNLDAILRENMRGELRRLQQTLGITTVYVTHDQLEALALSDNIAVMQNGRVMQHGSPKAIYNNPANRFVAEFVGTANLLTGRVRRGPSDGLVEVEIGRTRMRCRAEESYSANQQVFVLIRPEFIRLQLLGNEIPEQDANVMRGRIIEQSFLGSISDSLVDADGQHWRVWSSPNDLLTAGTEVLLVVETMHCTIVPEAPTEARAEITESSVADTVKGISSAMPV